MWWTSTSYIDFSTESGSMPWLIVRLPCGSMSTASTRWPASANATARFRVVVVFATPPFWLANAITSRALDLAARRAAWAGCGRGSAGAGPQAGRLRLRRRPLVRGFRLGVVRGLSVAVDGSLLRCGFRCRLHGVAAVFGALSAGLSLRPERNSGRANRWSKPIALGYSHQRAAIPSLTSAGRPSLRERSGNPKYPRSLRTPRPRNQLHHGQTTSSTSASSS